MKNFRFLFLAFFITVLGISFIGAQSTTTNNIRGMSFNGTTGLFTVPTGQIAWGQNTDVGLDLGYHAIIHKGDATNLPAANVSLFKLVEFSAAYDVQPKDYSPGNDFIGGAKVQLPITKTNIAIGGNFQALNVGKTGDYSAGQLYVAVTYPGQFFSWPAETTMVVGKTFCKYAEDWDIDFGMGFDLVILPTYLNNFVHWVTDFSNFSYSWEAFGANATYRGDLNTGLRIDLAQIPALSKFKFQVDVLMTDAFDNDRSFSVGAVFGVPIL